MCHPEEAHTGQPDISEYLKVSSSSNFIEYNEVGTHEKYHFCSFLEIAL